MTKKATQISILEELTIYIFSGYFDI